MSKIFEIYLYRPGIPGNTTGVSLVLPATPYEVLDALEKARITDDGIIYSTEVMDCELEYLPQFIAPSANIHELNHLAHRLAELDRWQLDCFEGMTMMDAVKTGYSPIPMERLVNLTHSMEDCQVVYEAHDDTSLGNFYADNGFVSELETLSEKIFPWLDYSKIGKEMREAEGGVFTPSGYVVQSGEIADLYHSGDTVPLEKPDYMVLFKVTKGYCDAPCAYVKLPAREDQFKQAVLAVDAASAEECVYTAEDCIVPWMSELITDTLEAGDGCCSGTVQELARQFQKLSQHGSLTTYKAMLEAAPKDITLEEALDLTYQTEVFSVIRQAASPADYARFMLSKYCIEQADTLFENANLHVYGEKLIAEKGISLTEYGALWSMTDETVEQCLNRPCQSHSMEMK